MVEREKEREKSERERGGGERNSMSITWKPTYYHYKKLYLKVYHTTDQSISYNPNNYERNGNPDNYGKNGNLKLYKK